MPVLAALFGCVEAPDAADTAPFPEPTPLADRFAEPPEGDIVPVNPEGPALIETDPVALAPLSLKRVLEQLLVLSGDYVTRPEELLQRTFDTWSPEAAAIFDGGIHCDSPAYPANGMGPPPACPRAEAALARSEGLFTPGDEDYFYPVAAVNRLDLRAFKGQSCGEVRLIYAKASGLTDPTKRIFLALEMSLDGPVIGWEGPTDCSKLAWFWYNQGLIEDPAERADRLESFFYRGMTQHRAPVAPDSLGFNQLGTDSYYSSGAPGRMRLTQLMDETLEMVEVRPIGPWVGGQRRVRFMPVLLANSLEPRLFESPPSSFRKSYVRDFQHDFVRDLSAGLAADRVEQIGLPVPASWGDKYWVGESTAFGGAEPDYASHAADNATLLADIDRAVQSAGVQCPRGEPLTAEAVLRRASAMSCAGCHAPSQVLGAERDIGCGLTWPASLGVSHVDEHGNLSPALRDVFLPDRADRLTQYVEALAGQQ